jgi:hypothetical protein
MAEFRQEKKALIELSTKQSFNAVGPSNIVKSHVRSPISILLCSNGLNFEVFIGTSCDIFIFQVISRDKNHLKFNKFFKSF